MLGRHLTIQEHLLPIHSKPLKIYELNKHTFIQQHNASVSAQWSRNEKHMVRVSHQTMFSVNIWIPFKIQSNINFSSSFTIIICFIFRIHIFFLTSKLFLLKRFQKNQKPRRTHVFFYSFAYHPKFHRSQKTKEPIITAMNPCLFLNYP